MANHRSAEKRHLRSLKKNAINRANRSRLAGQIKKARADLKNTEEVIKAQSLLAKMAQKGLIHKKTAARRTERLMKQASSLR